MNSATTLGRYAVSLAPGAGLGEDWINDGQHFSGQFDPLFNVSSPAEMS